jgi:hypothetical protein
MAARKPKPKEGTVDLVAELRERAEKKVTKKAKERAKVVADAEAKGLPVPADRPSFSQRRANQAREANKRIQGEKSFKIKPLVIEYLGNRVPVVDANGTWAMRTPPYLQSAWDLVAHSIAKPDPSVMAVVDLETWQLLAGVLHHGASLRFNDDERTLGDEDRAKVEFHKTWDDLKKFLLGLMAELINKCLKDPEASSEGKVWAHNGSNFDWVGLALHLGMDRVTGYWCEIVAKDENGEDKEYKVSFRISSFAGKSRMTLFVGRGNGGEFRIQLLDSYHIITAPISALGDKGVTPLQFTNPLAWINEKKCKITGENFTLTEEDVRPYLYLAHKQGRTLQSFLDSGEITDIAHEGLSLWLATLDNPEYTCDDVIILANAMKSYAAKFRFLAKPLADLLGQEVVDSLRPFSYNTASSGGFALAVAYWYESRLERDDSTGVISLKKSLQDQQKSLVYALVGGGRDYAQKMNEFEAQDYIKEQLAEGKVVKIQKHGIVRKGEAVLVEYPVWTSSFDNCFSRMAQNGSQTTVFKTIAHQMLEVDSNSAFPFAMARGCERTATRQGYEHNGITVGRYENPVRINALVGYEDPNRCARPTKDMISMGIATSEEMLNEHGHMVKMWVVRGRQKILTLLHIRNGEFSVVLPPSLDPELNEVPGLPIRTPGRALDSRLINPRIAQPSLLLLRGEYIASYALSKTVDDNAMVIYLGEDFIDEKGRKQFRDRSRHGPIMGIYVSNGIICGQPHNPLKKFTEIAYNKRLEEKNLAKKALAAGDLKLHVRMTYEATMTKLILNGGSYGTFAQNKKPEIDFDLEDLGECLSIIELLVGLDPNWAGMQDCIKRLTPGYEFQGDTCTWADLYNSIEIFNERRLEAEENIESSPQDVQAIERIQIAGFRLLFSAWAENQITTFTSYRYKSPELDELGERVIKIRGIITAAEETASHAIRCFASAVVAKAAVNLHQGQLAIQRSPFGLAYSDTDSLHAETGIIKPFDDVRVVAYVTSRYEATYGDQPDDPVAGLQRLMNDPEAPRTRIFTDILEMYGLRTGELLGQWGLEEHKYTKGLVSPVADGQPYDSHRTFYLGPKVYVDTDRDNNAARTKVRSIPKINPVQPAVFEGMVVSIPSLADRRGLDQENFRSVKLDETREMKFGKNRRKVEMLFSSPRRKYPDASSSKPFDLMLSPEMNSRILRGDLLSPDSVSRDAMATIGLDEDFTYIKGLQDAYMVYKGEIRIKGMSFDDVKQQVSDDIAYKQRLINYQQLRETENPIKKSTRMVTDEEGFFEWLDREFDEIEEEMKKED